MPSVTLKTRMTVPDNDDEDIYENDNDEGEYDEESTSLRGSG